MAEEPDIQKAGDELTPGVFERFAQYLVNVPPPGGTPSEAPLETPQDRIAWLHDLLDVYEGNDKGRDERKKIALRAAGAKDGSDDQRLLLTAIRAAQKLQGQPPGSDQYVSLWRHVYEKISQRMIQERLAGKAECLNDYNKNLAFEIQAREKANGAALAPGEIDKIRLEVLGREQAELKALAARSQGAFTMETRTIGGRSVRLFQLSAMENGY